MYFVRFKGKNGGYARVSTSQTKKPQAIDEAHRLILEEYQQIAPTSETVTWEVARDKLTVALTADNKRPKTIRGYGEALDRLVEMVPLAKGLADISDRMADDFKEKYARATFSRKPAKKGETVPVYTRATKPLDSRPPHA